MYDSRLSRNPLLSRFMIIGGGILAGLLVFWINSALVEQPQGRIAVGPDFDLELEQVAKPKPPEEKVRRQPEPPEPPRPPEEIPSVATEARIVAQPTRIEIAATELPGAIRTGLDASPGLPADYGSDTLVPLIRVEPNYPGRAAARGIEGEVQLAFTVLADGSVSGVEVLRADPRGVFEHQAMRAVARWKFRPRAAGAPPRRATQTLKFRLPDENRGR